MQAESPSTKPRFFTRRTISLRWYLVLLVAGVILPLVVFAILVTYKLSIDERAQAERRLLVSTQILNGTLEQEFSATIRTLQSLAVAESLEKDDLADFYVKAARVNETQPTWLTVILLSPDGRQLLNVKRPFGEGLPPMVEPESFQQTLATRQPTVGNIKRGDRNSLAFPIRVPVFRQNDLKYVLTAVISTEALTQVVKQQTDTNFEWTRSVIDGNGFVVARTREPERFVGVKAPETFLEHTKNQPEGVYQDVSLDKVEVYVGFVRSEKTNWTTAVIVPSAIMNAPGRQAIRLVIGFGFGLLLFSCFGAVLLSRRISKEITSASKAAQLLVKGLPLDARTASRIEEVKQLNEALEFSSQLLSQREEEREKHLAEAEAARVAAETANKLKDEFLITVSHELRTPLNSILGWITLLRGNRFSEDKTAHAHAVIEKNARSQASLIEDLLDMSRIITGKLKLETDSVNLNEIIRNVVDSSRHAAESKGIELELKSLTDLKPLVGDAVRLQQIVWNLVSNAIKFTPIGGRILIEERQSGTAVEIIVSDTGSGIEPDFLPFVFERFRQADGSTKRNHSGLGLGLAIVKQLVELHGGSVAAESRGTGSGATFTVSLPLKNQTERPKTETVSNNLFSAEAALPKLKSVKVLVVDDEPDARELVETVLAQQGAEVRTAGSVFEALRELKEWTPTIILSDIGMPNEDGFDFIRQLKELEVIIGRRIPAAALTAYTRQEDRARALAAGYAKHISKPIDSFELIGLVSSLVEET